VSFAFNPHHGLIVVGAELHGPSGSIVLRLALDTGASTTMISVAPLVTAGYDPALVGERVQVDATSSTSQVVLDQELRETSAVVQHALVKGQESAQTELNEAAESFGLSCDQTVPVH